MYEEIRRGVDAGIEKSELKQGGAPSALLGDLQPTPTSPPLPTTSMGVKKVAELVTSNSEPLMRPALRALFLFQGAGSI